MKTPIVLICMMFVGGCSALFSQNTRILNESQLEITADLNFETDVGTIVRSKNSGTWYLRDKDETTDSEGPMFDQGSIISGPKIHLKDGDIIIEFELAKQTRKNVGEAVQYDIHLKSVMSQEWGTHSFPMRPEWIYGDAGMSLTADTELTKRIIIANPPENDNLKYLNGQVTFSIAVSMHDEPTYGGWLKVRCNEPVPTLKPKKFIANLITIVAGGVVYAVGADKKSKSNEVYNTQYRVQSSKELAEPFYQDANSLHKQSLVIKRVGIGLAATGFVWGVGRYLAHRERIKMYEDYCGPQRASVRTYYSSPDLAAVNGQVGLSFLYRF